MKKLPEQFSVYAETINEARYICEKQRELCGGTFNTPEKGMFYRFCPNYKNDSWGFSSTSYINAKWDSYGYNIQHEFTFKEFKSYFEDKVCFEGDGTERTGERIIEELEKLGGINTSIYQGTSNGRYYYINDKGNVDMEYVIPKGYTLTELPSKVKLNVNNKVCFKSDGTDNTGTKIINELIRLGGKNVGEWDGNSNNRYYYINDKGNVDLEYAIPQGYKLVSLNKEIKMKNRILTPQNATRIINIACSTWKPKLAEKWATNIVLNKDTEIPEEFYQEMRKACTTDQNTLFDEIFGIDEQLEAAYNLEVGEALLVIRGNNMKDKVVLRTYNGFVDIYEPMSTWSGLSKDVCGKKVKLTITYEEIK